MRSSNPSEPRVHDKWQCIHVHIFIVCVCVYIYTPIYIYRWKYITWLPMLESRIVCVYIYIHTHSHTHLIYMWENTLHGSLCWKVRLILKNSAGCLGAVRHVTRFQLTRWPQGHELEPRGTLRAQHGVAWVSLPLPFCPHPALWSIYTFLKEDSNAIAKKILIK